MQVSRASLLCFCALMVLLTAPGVPGSDQPRPGVSFTVSPAATGLQVVRVSLPLPPGFLGSNQLCSATAAGSQAEPAALRVLSWHSAANSTSRTARRALVTFRHRFANTNPVAFMLQPAKPSQAAPGDFPVTLVGDGDSFTLGWKNGRKVELKFIAPQRQKTTRNSTASTENRGTATPRGITAKALSASVRRPRKESSISRRCWGIIFSTAPSRDYWRNRSRTNRWA